ncbi:MAG: hypothetical protein J6Y37_02020 [Paludibacteraceae bacterium]|nr:hypothetical protein [Paludibacteraceae bacterium]
MRHKTTKVWEVNEHRLVIADTLQEAANIYDEEFGTLEAVSVKLVASSSQQSYALTKEIDDDDLA